MSRYLLPCAALLLAAAPRPAAASPGATDDAPETADSRAVPVVGGTQVPDGKWRDAAAVLSRRGTPFCTGVLIAPTLALTAGHCAGGISAIKIGVTDYTDAGGETIEVADEIAYPQWWQSYDIALLVLARPATIEPRLIATGCVRERYLADGAPVTIVGYGALDADASEYGTALMEATTTVTDHDCSAVERGCVSAVSPNGELGAGGDGIDSCSGDSGGPLYLNTEHGDFLVGITSRAWDDATVQCSQGGVYVRPDAIIDWIESETGVDIPEPTCNAAPVPDAPEIVVEAGTSESTSVAPNDPDAADSHSYAIAVAPEHGVAEVAADGTVTFTADQDYAGPDQLTVRVTDSGVPALSGDVVVLITVTEPPGGCCRVGSGRDAGGTALLLAIAVLGAVRRRS